jgi:hypothetical protein
MEYLLLLNPGTRAAEIYTDSRGFPELFNTYKAAKDYATKYELAPFQVLAVCDDQKNYLV